jgi:hypothetical protein
MRGRKEHLVDEVAATNGTEVLAVRDRLIRARDRLVDLLMTGRLDEESHALIEMLEEAVEDAIEELGGDT